MANVNRVNGFRPVGTLTGAPWTAAVQRLYHAAGADLNLNIGDNVKLSGTSDAAGVPGVLIATATDDAKGNLTQDIPCGVVVGIEPSSIENLKNTYMPGLTAGYVLVCTDPNIIMEVQVDGKIEAADVGLAANLVQTTAAASCTKGVSGQQLDQSTKSTTSTRQFNIIGLPQRPDNTINSDYNRVLVTYNAHQFKGVGVTAV